MADNKSTKLDEGFEEVPLDDGFEEVPLDNRQPQSLDLNAKIPFTNINIPIVNSKIGKALQSGASDLGEASAAGVVSGVESGTSNLAGKALALGLAGKDVLAKGGVPDVVGQEGLVQKYQKYKQQIKDKEAQMASDSPIASGIGSGVGLLAGSAALPELGGEAAIGKLGAASPGLDTWLAGKSGNALSKIAGKGAGSAIEGAPLGIAQGIGDADNAKDTEDALKGIASSALMTSAGGLALGTGLKSMQVAGEEAPKLMDKWDYLRKMKQAYNYGKGGQSFDTSAGRSAAAAITRSIPNEITDTLIAADQVNGKKVGMALDPELNASARTPVNIDPTINESVNSLSEMLMKEPALMANLDPKSKKLLQSVVSMQGGLGSMSQQEARALEDALFDLSGKMDGLNSDISVITRDKANSIGRALDETIKAQNSSYKDAAQKFAEYRSQMVEPLLEPNLPPDKRTKYYGDLKNKETKLYSAVDKVFGGSLQPGQGALKHRVGFDEILDNLSNIEKSNPDAMATLGGSADDVRGHWNDLAEKLSTINQSQGVHQTEGALNTLKGSVVGTGEGYTYNLASQAGKAVNWMGSDNRLAKVATKLFGADNSALSGLAENLRNSDHKALQLYGKRLGDAVQNKQEWAKRAILYDMSQNPDYRNYLRDNGWLDSQDRTTSEGNQ